jgi:hypothetical protein
LANWQASRLKAVDTSSPLCALTSDLGNSQRYGVLNSDVSWSVHVLHQVSPSVAPLTCLLASRGTQSLQMAPRALTGQ